MPPQVFPTITGVGAITMPVGAPPVVPSDVKKSVKSRFVTMDDLELKIWIVRSEVWLPGKTVVGLKLLVTARVLKTLSVVFTSALF